MSEQLDPSSILEALSGLQGGGRRVQGEFRTLQPEEQNLFIHSRLLKVLSGVKQVGWNAANELDGLSFNVDKKSLYVSNMMNAIHFLAAGMSLAKRDVDPWELEQQMGTTSPEDEAAIRYIKIPFEWQQEPGGEVIKTEVGLWDALSVWLDVKNMRNFELFIAGNEEVVRGVANEYFPTTTPDRAREIDKVVDRVTGDGDKIFARDFAFDAIMMRKMLWFSLGLGEREEFHGLPEYTSLMTPVGFPVENLKHIPEISDPEGTQTSYLWDALGPFIFAAEGFSGVTGDSQIVRQDIGPWTAMQAMRSFITKEAYEIDAYNTTSFLATDLWNMAVIYDALLHRMVYEKGVQEQVKTIKLREAGGAERRFTSTELKVIDEITTMEILFDPRGLDFMVNQKRSRDFGDFLRSVDKMQPRGSGGKVERRARPIGTWGAVARGLVDAHLEFFDRPGGSFQNLDFIPWMEQLGIKRNLLGEIRSQGANVGGHIGKEGLVTLFRYAGMRLMKIPTTPRNMRNWFHYAKSVNETLEGNVKPAMEIAFQSNISDVDIQRAIGNRPLEKGVFPERAIEAVIQIERDVARLVGSVMGKISDPQNKGAYRFKEGPETKSYIIDQALLAMIQAHLVYPVARDDWMNSESIRKLRQKVPSAGYLVEPDWDDFVKSGGTQMRPKRINRNEFNNIAASLGESPATRESALISQGYYWMPWKGKSSEGVEEVLHHPIRKPVRRLVGLGEYLQGFAAAVNELERKGVNVERLRSLLGRKSFSPVHLEGIYAFPGEAIRVGLVAFEDTGSGTPFLKSGDLDNIREIIDMYEKVGLLPSTFTTIRPFELKKNKISEYAWRQGQTEIARHINRLTPLHLPPDPLVARLAPQHLKLGILGKK